MLRPPPSAERSSPGSHSAFIEVVVPIAAMLLVCSSSRLSIYPCCLRRCWSVTAEFDRHPCRPRRPASSLSRQTRSDMRYVLLAAVLIGAATLGGCSEGVLDPKGPIAAAERLIMLNSTGIMLAI